MYYKMDRIIRQLEKGEQKKDKEDTTTDEKDYTVDEKAKSAQFSDKGLSKVEKLLGIDNISDPEHLQEMQYATAALKAHGVFKGHRLCGAPEQRGEARSRDRGRVHRVTDVRAALVGRSAPGD